MTVGFRNARIFQNNKWSEGDAVVRDGRLVLIAAARCGDQSSAADDCEVHSSVANDCEDQSSAADDCEVQSSVADDCEVQSSAANDCEDQSSAADNCENRSDSHTSPHLSMEDCTVICENCIILPGLTDVHVHLREPGFSYKETIKTGTMACAHGGYTAVCPMPNLNPVPDSRENLQKELEIIEKDACIRVLPYGAVTVREQGETLSDMDALAAGVIGFSDDGRGIQDGSIMETAMTRAKKLDKIIAAHCEVNSLLYGGYIHDGAYAKAHGHRGICSASEFEQIARDLELARKTGCAYHVCHISTKESVELIRKAKAEGINVTCETAPHYLLLTEDDLCEEGRFKMNPPLREKTDREALLKGIQDGTIDMIATDHAPHSDEEKSRGLEKSPMGIVGIETAFPLLYTCLVEKGVISLQRLVELMITNPKKRFGIDTEDDFTIFETATPFTIDPSGFLSMGHATPFAGWQVRGRCLLTVCKEKIAYKAPQLV